MTITRMLNETHVDKGSGWEEAAQAILTRLLRLFNCDLQYLLAAPGRLVEAIPCKQPHLHLRSPLVAPTPRPKPLKVGDS